MDRKTKESLLEGGESLAVIILIAGPFIALLILAIYSFF